MFGQTQTSTLLSWKESFSINAKWLYVNDDKNRASNKKKQLNECSSGVQFSREHISSECTKKFCTPLTRFYLILIIIASMTQNAF